MPERQRPTWRDPFLLWIFFSSLFVSVGYTHLVLSTNETSRYSLTKSIVTRGTLEIGPTLELFEAQAGMADRAVFEGRTYSDKAPLASFLGVPPAAIAHAVFADHQEYWRIFATSIFIAALPLAITGVLIYLLALGYGASREWAVLVTGGAVFGTNCLYWSTAMFSHSLSTCLLLASFYLIKKNGRRRTQFFAGLLAGLAVASDYYLIVLLPVFFLAGSFSWYRKESLTFVVGAAVAGCFPALYHMAIFGDPLVLPYRHQPTFGARHAIGVYSILFPSLKALWHISFSQHYGLFFYNPFLLVAVLCGPAFLHKWKRDFWLVSVMTVVLFLLIASIQDPSYGIGFSWGPRYLMPLVPFFALTVAATDLQGVKRKLFYILLVVSVSLNFYILNLFVVPPLFSAFEYLHGRGWNSIVEYGGFNLVTQWFKFVRGSPLSATVAGLVSLLVVTTPLAVLFCLVRRERADGSCRGGGDGREEDVVNATSLTNSAPA